jgi:hypothetical protein
MNVTTTKSEWEQLFLQRSADKKSLKDRGSFRFLDFQALLVLGPLQKLLPPFLFRSSVPLHGRKFNPNSKFSGTAEAYFVCHIGPIFQISLIYAIIGFP